MEVICINAKFSPDTLEFWARFGVIHPQQDTIYTIRDVIINSSGDTGLLLEEIQNPKVVIKHPINGTQEMEPNFNISRFSTLTGDVISREQIREVLKQLKHDKAKVH